MAFSGSNFLNEHLTDFGYSSDYSFVPISDSDTDNIGDVHKRYVQTYKDIPIEDNNIITHQHDGIYFMLNGDLTNNLEINVNEFISESSALENALSEFPGAVFFWQDTLEENDLIRSTGDENATYYPVGERVIACKFDNGDYVYEYCWKFGIAVKENAVEAYYVYIKCSDGLLFDKVEDSHNCNGADGTANTPYYGTQNLRLKSRGWPNNDFTLETCEFGDGIRTRKKNNLTEINLGSSNWGTNHQHGTQAHMLGQRIYSYYQNIWDRNSYNNKGAKIKILVEWQDPNANWSGLLNRFQIGISATGHPLSAADVMGHEFTHAVIDATCNLKYKSESGALNEGFADIFGTLFERNFIGAGFDFTIGEDVTGMGAIRNMLNPNAFQQPDIVGGNFYTTSSADNYGVHTNSGIPNRWFSLLCNTATHNSIFVQGINIDHAARIAYNSMANYFTKKTNFSDARNLTNAATARLFGKCSQQYISCDRAWAAVGVGGVNNTCFDIVTNTVVCKNWLDQIIVFKARIGLNGISATNYSWGIPSPVTSYSINFDEFQIEERSNSSSFNVSCTGSRTGFSFGSSVAVKTVTCNIMYKKSSGEANFAIYPNPTNGRINISGFLPKSNYAIYTLEGKIIKQGNLGFDESTYIDLGVLNNGLYFISFLDIDGGFKSKKIVLIK